MKAWTAWLIFLLIVSLCRLAHANPDLLKQMRSTENHIIRLDSVRDLFLMENDALPFLIQTLSDESENARQRAAYLLENYFGDPKALSALSVTFLYDTDNKVRNSAARSIANINAEYAKNFLEKHLDADYDTQVIVIDVLSNLKDARVIPKLVERLKDPETREDAAYALADFKDKRVLPFLIDKFNDPKIQTWTLDEIIEKFAHINDEQTYPMLLKLFDPEVVKRGGNLRAQRVAEALSQAKPAIVPLLLKMVEQLESRNGPQMVLPTIRGLRNPKLAPIIEKAFLETDNTTLRSALIGALINMGTKGFESLLSIMQQKPDAEVLDALTTYNSKAAIEAVASFALDKLPKFSYKFEDPETELKTPTFDGLSPLRGVAIRRLAGFGDLGKGEICKHIPQLLADPNSKVKLLTLDLIRQMQLKEFLPALKSLTQDIDENIRNAAHIVLDILSGKPQLKLDVVPDQQQYNYGQPIELTYRLKNVSNYPIMIGRPTVGLTFTPLILNSDGSSAGYDYLDITLSEYDHIHVDILTLGTVGIEILNPDGTSARVDYMDVNILGTETDGYKTLNPGEELNGTISVSEEKYWLHQVGMYTVNLHITPSGNDFDYYSEIARSNRISSQVHFNIKPPTTKQVDAILKRVDSGRIHIHSFENRKTYHQLCELDKIGLFPALKTHALVPLDKISGPGTVFWARRLGPTFLELSNEELVPKCIEMLTQPAMKILLGYLGDKRAIKPLRYLAIDGSALAAAALQELGDAQAVKWCQEHAKRKLRHWNKEKRVEGAEMLWTLKQSLDINQGYTQQWFWTHQSLKTRGFYEQNDSPTLAADWAEIVKKAMTLEGLKALLEHPIPAVRLGAAYELAYLGDKSGIKLIEQDLQANELEIRNQARDTLLKLHSE
ncbi:MAG: HEAT repeat domain-containing protein [Candidatus Poribacteria bacterium]|nr:HEAT repeat domain-containing protein [Candidatus Poribacteria bacterium]